MTHSRISLEPKGYVDAFRKNLSGMLDAVWKHSGGQREAFIPALIARIKVALFDPGRTLDIHPVFMPTSGASCYTTAPFPPDRSAERRGRDGGA